MPLDTRTKTRREGGLCLRGTALGAAVAIVGLLSPTPAVAESGAGLEFEGVASLPTFPCSVTEDCTGDFTGVVSGPTGGEDPRWNATLTTASLEATFDYTDFNCVNGRADGTATVTADPDQVRGVYQPDGPLPQTVVGLSAHVDFSWERHGLTAVLTLFDLTVDLELLSGEIVRVVPDAAGVGSASFVPLLDPDELPECEPVGAPGQSVPLDAAVTGTVALSDAP